MKNIATGLLLIGLACTAQAEEISIQQVGLSFEPNSVTVSPGDVITWTRTGGTHDAVHGRDCFESTDEGGIYAGFPYFNLQLTASSPTATWTVPNAVNGRIPYFCSVGNHCISGMSAEIIVVPRAGSTIVTIEQDVLDYIPEITTASPGDTIVWNHNNGGHSIHSGDFTTCSNDDAFALPLDFIYDQVIWQIPDDYPEGVFEYFCIFHCEIGHIGAIEIEPACGTADLDCDGCVSGADLTILLGSWGPCTGGECPADITGDGNVDGADLTVMLGNWSGC